MPDTIELSRDLLSHYHRQRALSHHFEQARLPLYSNTAGRVTLSLCRRVGQSSLTLIDVAEELCMSPRTLQRHLQRERITFLSILEQVRHHYALKMLMVDNLKINDIFASLYYADRSSFSIAFKRWTGIAPEVFRKLYRDAPRDEVVAAQTPTFAEAS